MNPSNPDAAASLLLEARLSRSWLTALPEPCRPKTMVEAYAVQDAVMARLGPVAAWKVGAGNPEASPACAAIAATTLFPSGARLPANMFNLIGIEAELAYRFVRDLPTRDTPYSPAEVMAAIGSIHPAIEISDTRFYAWGSQDRPSHVADQLNHGALVVGPGLDEWWRIDPAAQRTMLTIDGVPFLDIVGGNPAGDPMRLLVWLANEGARAHGGLRAGTIVTSGSLTGVEFARGAVRATADMPGLGLVEVEVG